MNEFENKFIKDIHATRYIASWSNVGGTFDRKPGGRFDFRVWLESLGLEEDEVRFIFNLATNGKLELQEDARKCLRALKNL